MCVWVKCESNGTWRLGTCIKIYLFSNLKKSAPAHPRRGRCSQNKSVMLSISNLTPVWVCKGMKIWQDAIRYVECRGLSLFVSRWLAFRRLQQHLLWRQRQQEIDDSGIGPVRVKPWKRQRKWGDHRCAMPSWPTLTQEMALMHGCS